MARNDSPFLSIFFPEATEENRDRHSTGLGA
jgi:hypothetical protein